jgi:hypothetical protein
MLVFSNAEQLDEECQISKLKLEKTMKLRAIHPLRKTMRNKNSPIHITTK